MVNPTDGAGINYSSSSREEGRYVEGAASDLLVERNSHEERGNFFFCRLAPHYSLGFFPWRWDEVRTPYHCRNWLSSILVSGKQLCHVTSKLKVK